MTIYDIIKELGVTKCWSPLLGNCDIALKEDSSQIWIYDDFHGWTVLDRDGKFYEEGECLIFPSKDNRDWNKALEEHKKKLLPFNTLVMVSDHGFLPLWSLRYYKKYRQCDAAKENTDGIDWKYIVPVSKFNFEADDLSINIKNSI